MDKITGGLLNNLLTVYIGCGYSSYPRPDSERVITQVGADEAARYLPTIEQVITFLKDVEPNWTKHNLVEASRQAAAQARTEFPWIDSHAESALSWLFSWWYK